MAAIVAADRVAARFVWEVITQTAARLGIPDSVLVAIASDIFALHDRSVDVVTNSYAAESRAKMREEEAERSALVGALLDGRTLPTVEALTERSLSEPRHVAELCIALATHRRIESDSEP